MENDQSCIDQTSARFQTMMISRGKTKAYRGHGAVTLIPEKAKKCNRFTCKEIILHSRMLVSIFLNKRIKYNIYKLLCNKNR